MVIPLMGIADERLDRCERLLWDSNKQHKLDQEEIDGLYEEIERLVVENETLKVEKRIIAEQYERQLKAQKGLYIGLNGGYPLVNVDAIVMYKFTRFGIYLIGGYNQQPNIGMGFVVKIP